MGCGPGLSFPILRDAGARVIGVDVSREGLEMARSKNMNEISLLRGHILNLPLREELFDLVLCTEVLEHLRDPARGLQEINRVLRPGKILLVTVPWLWELFHAPYLSMVRLLVRYAESRGLKSLLSNEFIANYLRLRNLGAVHTHYVVPSKWLRLINSSGFRIVEKRGWIFFPIPFYMNQLIARIDLLFQRALGSLGCWLGQICFIVAKKT